MSYSTVGATVVETDKQGNQIDFLATWLSFKNNLEAKLGIFRDARGAVLTLDGKTEPLITTEMFNIIANWLMNVGKKAISVVGVAGKSTSDMAAALSSFSSTISGMRSEIAAYEAENGPGSANSFQGRISLPFTTRFMAACASFARGMNSTQWKAMNEQTKMEIFKQALAETPGGGLLAPFLDLPGMISTALKVLVYGGVVLGAFWLYRKVT